MSFAGTINRSASSLLLVDHRVVQIQAHGVLSRLGRGPRLPIFGNRASRGRYGLSGFFGDRLNGIRINTLQCNGIGGRQPSCRIILAIVFGSELKMDWFVFSIYPIDGELQAVFLGLDLERAALWCWAWAVF